jgi:Flp pilus assembly protein TadG
MQRRISFSRLRGRRGSTIVETALVLSLVLFTIFFIIELGIVLFVHQGLTERARSAVRYAVVNTYDATKIKNLTVYGNSAGTGTALFGLTTGDVTVSQIAVDNQFSVIRVRITRTPYQFIMPLFGMNSVLPKAEASMVVESAGATT